MTRIWIALLSLLARKLREWASRVVITLESAERMETIKRERVRLDKGARVPPAPVGEFNPDSSEAIREGPPEHWLDLFASDGPPDHWTKLFEEEGQPVEWLDYPEGDDLSPQQQPAPSTAARLPSSAAPDSTSASEPMGQPASYPSPLSQVSPSQAASPQARSWPPRILLGPPSKSRLSQQASVTQAAAGLAPLTAPSSQSAQGPEVGRAGAEQATVRPAAFTSHDALTSHDVVTSHDALTSHDVVTSHDAVTSHESSESGTAPAPQAPSVAGQPRRRLWFLPPARQSQPSTPARAASTPPPADHRQPAVLPRPQTEPAVQPSYPSRSEVETGMKEKPGRKVETRAAHETSQRAETRQLPETQPRSETQRRPTTHPAPVTGPQPAPKKPGFTESVRQKPSRKPAPADEGQAKGAAPPGQTPAAPPETDRSRRARPLESYVWSTQFARSGSTFLDSAPIASGNWPELPEDPGLGGGDIDDAAAIAAAQSIEHRHRLDHEQRGL